jgi:hypothetical protein
MFYGCMSSARLILSRRLHDVLSMHVLVAINSFATAGIGTCHFLNVAGFMCVGCVCIQNRTVYIYKIMQYRPTAIYTLELSVNGRVF